MRAETNPGAVQNCLFRLANTRRLLRSLPVHIGSEIFRSFWKDFCGEIEQCPCRSVWNQVNAGGSRSSLSPQICVTKFVVWRNPFACPMRGQVFKIEADSGGSA